MDANSKREDAAAAMRRINRAWIDGEVEQIAARVHPEMVMTLPGFAGSIRGREAFLGGFRDFCRNARIHEFREYHQQVDAVGNVVVVTFRYEMIYERSGKRWHTRGRDLWVFEGAGEGWIAAWRTMLDVEGERRGLSGERRAVRTS